jgi:hypothetical protein
MDENSIPEDRNDVAPTEPTRSAAPISVDSENEADVLSAGLKALAGASGGPLQTAVAEFLGGNGELLEATRSASSKAKKTAREELAAFLTSRLKLSAPLAKLVAPMLLKLFPVLGKSLGKDTVEKPAAKPKPKPAAKPKTKPKKKPKTTEKEKPAASTTKKKPKKKPVTKPKTTAKKPAKKPAGKTTTKKKPKTSKRSETVED